MLPEALITFLSTYDEILTFIILSVLPLWPKPCTVSSEHLEPTSCVYSHQLCLVGFCLCGNGLTRPLGAGGGQGTGRAAGGDHQLPEAAGGATVSK